MGQGALGALEAVFGVSMAGHEALVPAERAPDAAERDRLIAALTARIASIESAGGTPAWAAAMLADWLAAAGATPPITRDTPVASLLPGRRQRRAAWRELRARLHLPRLAFPAWARALFHAPTLAALALLWPLSRSALLPPTLGGVPTTATGSVPDLVLWLWFATAVLACGFLAQAIAERRWGWVVPPGLRSVGDLADAFVRQGGDSLWTSERIRALALRTLEAQPGPVSDRA